MAKCQSCVLHIVFNVYMLKSYNHQIFILKSEFILDTRERKYIRDWFKTNDRKYVR